MNPPLLKRTELTLLAADPPREERARALPDELLTLLYRQMRALAGPRRDLDDLVQAAAERALRAFPRFEGRSALSTWTYGVAYRTVLDHDRWFRRWSRRFSFSDTADSVDGPADWDGEVAFLELRRARRLHVALDSLPPAKRAVVVLHDLEGVEVSQIAHIVAANERTVRSRLRDGRKKLAALLAADPLFDVEASG